MTLPNFRLQRATSWCLAPLFCATLVVAVTGLPAFSEAQEAFILPFEPLGEGVSGTVVRRINQEHATQLQRARVNYRSEVRAERASASGGGEAMAEYQRGLGLYVVQDYAGAIAALEAAVQAWNRAPGEITDFRAVPDALFKLAEAYFLTGNEEMARVTVLRALALRPETESLGQGVGQAFSRFFEAQQGALGRQGRGAVTVQSNPPGLQVFVNGVDQGAAPAAVADLPAGEHYVQVRNSEGRTAGQRVTVQRGGSDSVNIDLARAMAERGGDGGEPRYLRSLRSAVQRGEINDGLHPFMRELASRQTVDFVVVGVIVRRETHYESLPFIYRASDGLFANVQPQSFDLELSSISVHAYQQASSIAAAMRSFPEDSLVTGAPIIVVAPAPVAATPAPSTPAPSAAPVIVAVPDVGAPTSRTARGSGAATAAPAPEPMPAPAPTAESPTPVWGQPAPAPAPAPAPEPAPSTPVWGQPAPAPAPAPAPEPAPSTPVWGQPAPAPTPAPAAEPSAPVWGQPAAAPQPQQPAWGQPAPQPQQPAWGQPAPQPQQPAWGQPEQQGGWSTASPGSTPSSSWGSQPAPAPSRDVSRRVDPEERDRSLVQRPVFWVAVGGVAAVAVTTAILLSAGGGSDGGARPVFEW